MTPFKKAVFSAICAAGFVLGSAHATTFTFAENGRVGDDTAGTPDFINLGNITGNTANPYLNDPDTYLDGSNDSGDPFVNVPDGVIIPEAFGTAGDVVFQGRVNNTNRDGFVLLFDTAFDVVLSVAKNLGNLNNNTLVNLLFEIENVDTGEIVGTATVTNENGSIITPTILFEGLDAGLYSFRTTGLETDAAGYDLLFAAIDDASVVPLPAAAPIFVAGLGGIMAMRRKKKSARS